MSRSLKVDLGAWEPVADHLPPDLRAKRRRIALKMASDVIANISLADLVTSASAKFFWLAFVLHFFLISVVKEKASLSRGGVRHGGSRSRSAGRLPAGRLGGEAALHGAAEAV